VTSRPRVLLVDDEPALRELLRAVLERLGYEIAGEASDGHEGIEQARRLLPDVVVMDLNMPQCNGIEATVGIKAEQPELPVVFYSAYADESLRTAAADAGGAEWVLKGAPTQELAGALDRALGRVALQR